MRLPDSVLVRYGVAIALVVLAEILRRELPPAWAAPHWALLFGPAVLLSACLGGFGPGLVATAGSVAAVAVLVMHVRLSTQLVDWVDLLVLVVFVVLGLAASIVAGANRREAV
jgi:K+-sensing histidine kinase KdpD